MIQPSLIKKGRGGARNGAGTKSATTEKYQGSRRAQFETCVTAEDWRRIIRHAVDQAQQGDAEARRWLTPWVVGAEPKAVTIAGDAGAPLRVAVVYVDETPRHAE